MGEAVRTDGKSPPTSTRGARACPFADSNIRVPNTYSEHANWTREPRDDARAHGFFTSAGFDTGPDIDRVERPRMIQAHEASVSVGHAVITVPSALVAASGARC